MSPQDSAELTPLQDRVALLLATGRSVVEAAAVAEVGVRTIYDWRDIPRFRARVAKLQAAMVDAALGRLADAACSAVDTLVELLAKSSPTVRLMAAREILTQLVKIREHTDLAARLAELEGRLGAEDGDEEVPPR